MINDAFINTQELEIELKDMQQVAESFNLKFSLLSQQIAHVFSKIESCKTLESAHEYFEVLDMIQSGLACLLYKYNIGMPDRLIRFVQDFDNLEQIYREYYFKKITSGEYVF